MMDPALVNISLQYHGAGLLEQLEAEQAHLPLPDTMTFHRRPMGSRRDPELQQKLHTFIARKADLLFENNEERSSPTPLDKDVEDLFAIMPPVEAFMGVPAVYSKQHLFQSLDEGDILIGVVSGVQESGLIINLLCLDGPKAREIDHMKISAFCPIREVPRYYAHESPLEAFTIKDKVRGVVLSVMPESEKIIISLQSRSLPSNVGNFKIGLISDEELPVHYTRTKSIHGLTFNEMLDSTLSFTNPSNVSFLCQHLGLDEKHPTSLMRGLHGARYPKSEYAEQLRKNQSYHWSMKNVAEGILHFKAGRHTEAMQYLNKALQIDEENVEALVARGALYANHESYDRAIENFSSALKLDHSHQNARKYMVQTVMAKARSLFEEDKLDEARDEFEHALTLDPDLDEACHYIVKIKEKLAQEKVGMQVPRQDTLKEERSEKADESGAILTSTKETLRKMIEDEEEIRSRKRRKRYSSHESEEALRHRRRSPVLDEEDCRIIESPRTQKHHSRTEKRRSKDAQDVIQIDSDISPQYEEKLLKHAGKSEDRFYKEEDKRHLYMSKGDLTRDYSESRTEFPHDLDKKKSHQFSKKGKSVSRSPEIKGEYDEKKYPLKAGHSQHPKYKTGESYKRSRKDSSHYSDDSPEISKSPPSAKKARVYDMSEKRKYEYEREKQQEKSRHQYHEKDFRKDSKPHHREVHKSSHSEEVKYKGKGSFNKKEIRKTAEKSSGKKNSEKSSGLVSYPESPSDDDNFQGRRSQKRARSSSSSSSSTSSSSSSSSSTSSSSTSSDSQSKTRRASLPSSHKTHIDYKTKPVQRKNEQKYRQQSEYSNRNSSQKEKSSKWYQGKGKVTHIPHSESKSQRFRSKSSHTILLKNETVDSKHASLKIKAEPVVEVKKEPQSQAQPSTATTQTQNKELEELENFLDTLKQKKKEQSKVEPAKDYSKVSYRRWSLPQ